MMHMIESESTAYMAQSYVTKTAKTEKRGMLIIIIEIVMEGLGAMRLTTRTSLRDKVS